MTRLGASRAGVVLLLTSGLACAPRPAAAPRASTSLAAEVDSARKIARALVDAQRVPGFAVTVSIGESVVWRQGFGSADLSVKRPATPETQFRIGSVSKIITATLLMRLVEERRVELDAPIGRYLSLPPHLAGTTLRQLAGHLAGVRHYRGNEFLGMAHFSSPREALSIFAGDSLIAAPGSRYSYSSYGYNLIGAVLESATSTPYVDLVEREVLVPLGMTRTVVDVDGAPPDRAHTYAVGTDGMISDAPHDDLSGRWPSGGFISSTDDLVRLGSSVLGPGLLNARSLVTMTTPQRLTSGAPTSVGIGWRVSVDSSGRRYLHHGGTSNGGAAFLLVYPEQRLVVAMASNAFTPWGERDALAIASVFLRR